MQILPLESLLKLYCIFVVSLEIQPSTKLTLQIIITQLLQQKESLNNNLGLILGVILKARNKSKPHTHS
jgi:hypothetical protein